MAQQVSVKLVDDLDGSEATETVVFALDGRAYEMDLSERHAAKLRDALAPFVAGARSALRAPGRRPSAGTPRTARPTTNRERVAAIRAWARENGHTVADRGRISASLIEAYDQRDSTPVLKKAPKKARTRKLKAAVG